MSNVERHESKDIHMTQKEQVIEALAANGGYATFSELNLYSAKLISAANEI